MKTIETFKNCISIANDVLVSCGCVDGEKATLTEMKKWKADTVPFYINKAEIDANKFTTFIVVKVNSPTSIGKANNKSAFKKCVIYLDIITTKSQTDVKLLNQLTKIETSFEKKEWQFDMLREAELDSSSNRLTWSFEISKTL